MVTFETEATDIIERTPGVKSFRFKPGRGLLFRPGQFFNITIRVNGRERAKYFSFSNSPTENKYIEFTKRLTGSEFSNALNMLKPGDWARIKAPMGNFIYEGAPEKTAFLAGGIGITPIRSIFGFLCARGIDSDAVLIYGNKTERDIIFRDDFDRIARSLRTLRIIFTLTSPDADISGWEGRTGHINREMISREIPDYDERVFFLCGRPAVVSSLKGTLEREMRVQPGNVVTENFAGY